MNKYHAKKIKTPDGTFDSKAEYRRWCELKLLEKAGEITHLTRQPKFPIYLFKRKPVCTYIADFRYCRDGRDVVEDVKGVRTAIYRLKAKLLAETHGIEITEVAA